MSDAVASHGGKEAFGKREERLKVKDERKRGRRSFDFLWFWPKKGRVRVMVFRVFCGLGFFVVPLNCAKLPSFNFSPLLFCAVKTGIYRQNDLVPKTYWSFNFFIFLQILIFLFFSIFFKQEISTSTQQEKLMLIKITC